MFILRIAHKSETGDLCVISDTGEISIVRKSYTSLQEVNYTWINIIKLVEFDRVNMLLL